MYTINEKFKNINYDDEKKNLVDHIIEFLNGYKLTREDIINLIHSDFAPFSLEEYKYKI